MDIKFTDREADVMQILWDKGPSLVAEVQASLADPLAHTTVLTVLRTLEAKGYVLHTAAGRSHRYYAAIAQQLARKSALSHLTDKLFKGSTEPLLTHMVADKKLSAAQIRRMRELLAKQDHEEEP